MQTIRVPDPAAYRGLYVFDFGEWSAVGYTADEIAILLEDPRYREGKVYRIHGATPDGRMELQGVSAERFQLESGMLFWRATLGEARADFDALRQAAEQDPPPCRAFLHLAENKAPGQAGSFVTALIYPGEYDDDVAAWLLRLEYAGGDTAEGGFSVVTGYYELEKRVIDRAQLFGVGALPTRSADEVLASTRRAVQR